ncbi:MAG TPA: hypothetical protein VIM97_14720 [Actinomycetes bacterium]
MRLIALDPHTMQALGAAGMNPRVSVPVDREWTATLLPSAIIWISSKRRSSEAAKERPDRVHRSLPRFRRA